MDALTIHEAAETTGWSPRMLRYIESSGLVVPGRSSAGYRLYGPAELQRLRTLPFENLGFANVDRELLARFVLGLSDLGSAARMRADGDLQLAVDDWFAAEPAKPEHVDAADWLRWEQRKHERLLQAVSPTPIPVTENA